jgi:hypothetical protein
MNFSRQMTLANPSYFSQKQVTVIGAGGIGAMTTLLLAKCGFERITVYDYDTLEPENVPNQMLPLQFDKDSNFLGENKVVALSWLVWIMTGQRIQIQPVRYTNQPLSEVVVSAVDSMAVRRDIWNVAKNDPNVSFLVDGRMAREALAIYAVDLLNEANCEWYESTFHEDSEALAVPCTEKATIYTNAQIASWITKDIVAWSCEQVWQKLVRINMSGYLLIAE